MNNKEIAHHFSLLSQLMDIHGENSFRSKTYSIAAYKIGQLPVDLYTLSEENIFKISGIGEAIGKKIGEIITTGKLKILEDLIEKTPEGILEMLNIKGIGPKKIALIWKEMDIENIGELLYACNENRLMLYKGFGKKTQDTIIESIEFYLSQQGSFLFAAAEKMALGILDFLRGLFDPAAVEITGEFARHSETVDGLEYVIASAGEFIEEKLSSFPEYVLLEKTSEALLYKYNQGIKIKLWPVRSAGVVQKVLEATGSAEFVAAFEKDFQAVDFLKAGADTDLFIQAGIQYVPPFLRENSSILALAAENRIPWVIQPEDIRGIIHCHSKWSDGISTLEELAEACIRTGREYLVISDHSKSAAYANGLSVERIRAQHELIDELNRKLHPFRIFKSIESDILNDGSLDYDDEVLSTFDLVIASVHSNLKMNEDKAMMRVIRAIENPYTTILGHMTGRLLLSRKGFPLDYKKIIDACAANRVVIEINAHPRRLDMRWQWIGYALSRNVLLSIDPDAHSIPEFENIRYGVLAAQKGMVRREDNLSSYTLADFEAALAGLKI